ncbi:MAG: ATP-grasp domain-containing protein [Clostridia bacterium]|nr:ATP-grasp domain-containing protein [Clostridia bacterium]
MKNIAVFFGGESVEHDVSVITGVLTLNTVKKCGFNAVPVYVKKDGAWVSGDELFDVENYKSLDDKKLKSVFLTGGSPILYQAVKNKRIKPMGTLSAAVNCMHGERGEDGALSGLLSMCKVPLCSPGITPSATCIDKRITKAVLKGMGIKTLPCIAVKSATNIKWKKFPAVVKPNKLGSSIGVSVANDEKELKSAVLLALRYGEQAIIEEKMTDFIEINCAAYLDRNGKVITSPCEKPMAKGGVLTFDDKYTEGEREFPAKIEKALSDKIRKLTEKIYSGIDATGIIRIDFFVHGGEVFVNEINTVPGSLAYYLFCSTIKEFGKLLGEIIDVAERKFASQTTFIKSYDSGVLNVRGAKGAKHL